MPEENIAWPQGGEIDIMEAKGRLTNIAGSALHFGEGFHNKDEIVQNVVIPPSVRFQEKFHSITMEWREDSIQMFLDSESKLTLRIQKHLNAVFSPFHGDGMKLLLESDRRRNHYILNDFVFIVKTLSKVKRRSCNIGKSSFCFHDVDFTALRPCNILLWH